MGVYTTRKADILKLLFGSTSFTVESTLYLGLSTTSFPTSVEVSQFPTEPSGAANYARASMANGGGGIWSAITTDTSGAYFTNATQIDFLESTASWGQINGIFIAGSLAGTNLSDLLYYENLSSPITVGINTQVFFAQNALTIKMPASYT